jgi:hypothetical protein
MNRKDWFRGLAGGFCAASIFVFSGCSQQEAVDAVQQAEQAAEEAADTIAKDTEQMVEQGQAMAADLGEKAMAYLGPLKEKLGNLEGLKETPEELKTAVSELIQSIENKAEDMNLPEAVSSALASVKEKLVALQEYLQGEVEQAKIDEHIQGIMDTVKSGLGMSGGE